MSVHENVERATAFHSLASCYPDLHRIHGPQPEVEILLKASEEITTLRAELARVCNQRDAYLKACRYIHKKWMWLAEADWGELYGLGGLFGIRHRVDEALEEALAVAMAKIEEVEVELDRLHREVNAARNLGGDGNLKLIRVLAVLEGQNFTEEEPNA